MLGKTVNIYTILFTSDFAHFHLTDGQLRARLTGLRLALAARKFAEMKVLASEM